MISHEVTLRENIIWLSKQHVVYVVYHGSQTPEKLTTTIDQLRRICKAMRAEQQPILMLVDVRDIDCYQDGAKTISMRARTELPFWRMAIMVGKDDVNTVLSVSHQMNETSTRRKEITYFSSLPDAKQWLSQLRNDEDIFHFLQPASHPYRTAM